MVEPARRLDLDVLADHVESEFPGLFDVELQRLVGRCGVESVRPPALVERSEMEERLAVQTAGLHGGVDDRNLTHRGVTLDRVDNLTVTHKGDPQTVKVW